MRFVVPAGSLFVLLVAASGCGGGGGGRGDGSMFMPPLVSGWATAPALEDVSAERRRDSVIVHVPEVEGAEDFSRLTDYDLTWRDDARRFEVGTLPYQDYAAACASIELLLELGVARVAAHLGTLTARIVEWTTTRPDVRLVTPADPRRRAGIVTVAAEDAQALSARLTDAGVVHSFREGAIRLAPHCFNTMAEVDRALDLMETAAARG